MFAYCLETGEKDYHTIRPYFEVFKSHGHVGSNFFAVRPCNDEQVELQRARSAYPWYLTLSTF